MHAKIKNNLIIEYPIQNIRKLFSNTSLPEDLTNDGNLPEGYVFVNNSTPPNYDPKSQKLVEAAPAPLDGKWYRQYSVVALNEPELAVLRDQLAKEVTASRQLAFEQEADPLFFKAQRGEATIEQWQAKVAEIRARFPDL